MIFRVLFVASLYGVDFLLYNKLVQAEIYIPEELIKGTLFITLAIALALAGVMLLSRRGFWSISILVLLNAWMMANVLYRKANFTFINWEVICNAGQLRGFEDAVVSYLNWKQWGFLAIVLSGIFLFLYHQYETPKPYHIPWKLFGGIMGLASILFGIGIIINDHNYDFKTESAPQRSRRMVHAYTPAFHLLYTFYNFVEEKFWTHRSLQSFTKKENSILQGILTDTLPPAQCKGHLLFILVESWESWSMDYCDCDGVNICQNVNEYIGHHPVLLCKNVIAQNINGRSGDGQLITQTGLLPLLHGVTCTQYGGNVYPNLAHFYPNSVVLNPAQGYWNQNETTYSYGYKHLEEPPVPIFSRDNDSTILSKARGLLDTASVPTCLLTITMDMHSPFHEISSELVFPEEGFSKDEMNYLRRTHRTDYYLGKLLAWADTASTMKDATIVITADHNHFFRENGKGLCPLIILSPKIRTTRVIPEAYQMDIFPTVLSAIGQENYFWKGFGVNLLRDSIIHRSIQVDDALVLSDKLIRSNFFSSK